MFDAKSEEDLLKRKKLIKRATKWVVATVCTYFVGILGLVMLNFDYSNPDSNPMSGFFLILAGFGTQILALLALAVTIVAVKSVAQYLMWWLILLVVAITFFVRGLDFILVPMLF